MSADDMDNEGPVWAPGPVVPLTAESEREAAAPTPSVPRVVRVPVPRASTGVVAIGTALVAVAIGGTGYALHGQQAPVTAPAATVTSVATTTATETTVSTPPADTVTATVRTTRTAVRDVVRERRVPYAVAVPTTVRPPAVRVTLPPVVVRVTATRTLPRATTTRVVTLPRRTVYRTSVYTRVVRVTITRKVNYQ